VFEWNIVAAIQIRAPGIGPHEGCKAKSRQPAAALFRDTPERPSLETLVKFEESQSMAKTLIAMIAGAAALLMVAATPVVALAGGSHSGGSAGCGCKKPPPPPPPKNCGCTPSGHHTPPSPPTINVVVKTNVDTSASASASANASASARVAGFGGAQAQTFGGGGGGSSGIIPGPVSAVNLNVGGEDREAYEATRTRIEKVVIQAFCFDDKDVPHPASQVTADRDIDAGYEGEVYRCIAGSHMQVTIAQFREKISFEGGQTLACQKNEALYHIPGQGSGRLECRTQKPARDCNERSLLRRFGAGIKILTLVRTETYTAYRETSHGSESVSMSFDGGVGGIAY
jgi:hypothetical protein